MPEKHDLYQSYGEKLIGLFVRLLFSGERYSLTELSRVLNCSKQTVLRLLDNIRKSYGITIEETKEGNKNYYRIKKPSTSLRNIPLTEAEIQSLQLCKSFTQHLVGKKLYEEATRAIFKSKSAFGQEGKISECHFSALCPGTIDYTAQHQIIHTLIEAMEKQKVCKLTYQAVNASRPKTFYIKPLKLFSYHDAMYLLAQKAKEPGKAYKTPRFNPLLAVHRIKAVEMTNISFQPEPYDFEKTFNQHFGVMKHEAFEVEVEFKGWAASFIAERRWSPNQEIIKKGKNKVMLKFTASSAPEVKSWLLSFGDNATLIEPKWLVNEIKNEMVGMSKCYS